MPVKRKLLKFGLVVFLLALSALLVVEGIIYLQLKQSKISSPQEIRIGAIYISTVQIDGYDSYADFSPSSYTVAGKKFRVLEEKDGRLKIKMTMSDGGDYGWEGWIKKENGKYKPVTGN